MVPVPEYPASHVTVTLSLVFPVILLAATLFELATLIGVQGLAIHANVLNRPFVPHVAVPPPIYPVLHVTVTVSVVVPVEKLKIKS